MRRRFATAVGILGLMASMLTVTGVALAANPSANLDQCANDPQPSPPTDGCNTSATQWVNGNLGASKSIYREGDSIAYRMTFQNLAFTANPATNPTHVLIIEWDTTKSGKHSIDYLTTWNRTVANANPCLGVAGCSGAGNTAAIPADPQVTGAGVTPVAGNFTIWGATITGTSAYTYANGPGFAGDKSAQIAISFKASVANPVLAWGGHIATRQDWGAGNSAISIPGSPYHMRLISLDGAGGNQDRSLSADAVIFPAKLTIVKHADVASTTSFSFGGTDFTPNPFTLVDNSSSSDPSKDSNQILTFGAKTVSETNPLPGYKLSTIVCTSDMNNTYTPTVNAGGAGGSVSVNMEEGETAVCTFTNLKQTPSLTIDKTVTEESYDAVGQVLHYQIVATNNGNTTLAAVTVTDPNASGLTCTPANGSSLAPGASMNCTATHTITQADLNAGSYYNQACVDDGAGGATSVCDDVTTPAVQNPSLTIEKTATETGFSKVGDVIHYSITATNNGNVTLHNVVVTDAQVTDLSCTPTTPVANLLPGASITCTASHTVTQADLDDGDVYNQACVDDGNGDGDTGADSICDDVNTPPTKSPHLSIAKVDDIDSYDSVGDVIGYTITATNDGNVTLFNVTVTDPNASNLSCTPANGSDLAPGESLDCTADHTVTQADLDAGSYFNAACVNDDPDSDPGADEDCDDVTTPGDKNPSLSITKVDDIDSYDSVGDVIGYTIVATNDGNVTLHDVLVTDPNVSDLVCDPSNPVADLAPGDKIECTASHTVTQADIDAGSFKNAACVNDDPDSDPGADEDCADVTTPGDQNPSLSITKEADVDTFDSVGDVISYTIVATNDGNVTLHDVLVTDPNVSDLVCDPSNPVTDLAPGETIECTASHIVTQADLDAGSFKNGACVDDGAGGADEACDDVTTPGDQNPALDISKTTTFVGKFENVGDVISYSIVATNTGNITLHNVLVTDTQVTDLVCDPSNPVTDLAPGDKIECTASHTITAEDLAAGSFFNAACVNDDPASDPGADEACDDVTTPGKNQPTIDTDDYLVPQDEVTLAGLFEPSTGDLYIELRVDETCGQDLTPAWSYTWADVQNGTYKTADLTGADAQNVKVSTDVTIRWCTRYTGDANNAARALSDRGEVVSVDFDPVLAGAIGASVPMLAWFLWSRRRRENKAA
jgi:uncharacterized repeat protein (TIGR01451 family)